MSEVEKVLKVTVPEVRELAALFALDLDRLAQEMFRYIADRVPEARATEEIAALTLASCGSNIEAALSMIRHGISASASEAPVAALEHARRMAALGAGVDATLRFYRLGEGFFWQRWSGALVGAVPDRDRLVTALEESAAFVSAYTDVVSTRVSAELLAERERRLRRSAVLRADIVRAVLAGESVDVVAAERVLAHPLGAPQLAFVCWTAGDPAGLERAAAAIAQALGSERFLMLPDGPQAVVGWAVVRADCVPDLVSVKEASVPVAPEVHVALGEVGRGLDGFRATRDGAYRARRVAELAGRPAPTVTHYRDVAVVDLLSSDLVAAQTFVRMELGPLAARDAATARVRAALLIVAAPHGGLAAAGRELGVHRNTVLQRVRRAEELLGRAITVRPDALYSALLLAQTLPEAMLTDD